MVLTQSVPAEWMCPTSLPSESLQIEIAPVPPAPGPLVCTVAEVKVTMPVALTRIVDPDVPRRLEPELIPTDAPSIVRAPPEVEIVPAVVTVEPASISMLPPAVIVPLPVETVEAALEIVTF
jgi:hypothetical protein